ncbi:MAG: RHS repeat-associated core domain-containing protein, partial [Chloroflexota bacterium]
YGQAEVNPLSSIDNHFRLPGQYKDPETGFHYNWHRYYNAVDGRFLTPDPIGLEGGMNRYGYANENPVNLADPEGLAPNPDANGNGIPDYKEVIPRPTPPPIVTPEMLVGLVPVLLGMPPAPPTAGAFGRVASGSSCAAKTTQTVLGKFPDYLRIADELGARRFSVPAEVWNKMSKAEQWAANQKFLDRAIARGDKIVLSNPVKNISEVTGVFRRELDYLVEKGFRLSADGTTMVK